MENEYRVHCLPLNDMTNIDQHRKVYPLRDIKYKVYKSKKRDINQG